MNNRRRPVRLQNRTPGVPTAPARARESWYRIENVVGETPSIFLYDEVGMFGVTAAEFVKDLRSIRSDVIDLRVSSPGGDVFDGVAIHSALKNHPARINVHIDGLAASAASFIAMAGDEISIARNAQVMVHEGHAVCAGDSRDMRKCADLLDKVSDNIADVYAQRSGHSVDHWRAVMKEETWYTADEAVKAGLADRVSGATKPTNTWDLSVFMFAGRDKAPDPFEVWARHEGVADAPVVDLTQVTAMACPMHDTDTSGGTWDAGAHLKQMPSPMPVAMAKKMFGWYDAEAVEDGMLPKSAGKLPHHEMGENGPGAANLAGVRNALARLPQSDIPEADRAAVERHLRSHLAAQPEAHHNPPDEAGFLVPDIRAALAPFAPPDVPVDESDFRSAIGAALTSVPAPDPPVPPEPEPYIPSTPVENFVVPDIRLVLNPDIECDLATFRAAIELGVNDVPLPDPRPIPEPPAEEPGFVLSLPDVRRALKGALL